MSTYWYTVLFLKLMLFHCKDVNEWTSCYVDLDCHPVVPNLSSLISSFSSPSSFFFFLSVFFLLSPSPLFISISFSLGDSLVCARSSSYRKRSKTENERKNDRHCRTGKRFEWEGRVEKRRGEERRREERRGES